MGWLNNILEIIKLPVKLLIGIAVFSGSLFMLPEHILKKLKLDSLLNDFGAFLGIAFYGALILISVNFIYYIISSLHKKYIERGIRKDIEDRKIELDYKIIQKLHSLDPHEKAVLREFIIQAKNTIELPVDHHVVSGLINSGILKVISPYLTRNILIGILTSVSLSETARDYIFGNINIIEIPEGEPTEREKEIVLSQRPDFIRKIERFNNIYRR
jgi:hypothetical protein